jgi:bifunctional oligoribonuclease and PAP phosphatase NrnA
MPRRDFRAILQTIRAKKSFLISTHVNPDPDALAAQLSLGIFLRRLGKKVCLINENWVPQRYLFLPGARSILKMPEGRRRTSFEVALIVDCGDLNRIGAVQGLIDEKKIIINIDHHLTNQSFGQLNYVDTEASSTSEIVYDLIAAAKVPLTKEMALLLYLGIMTDTGSFRYENTTAYTHQVVAQLMKHNFSVSELYRKLYETIPLEDLNSFHKVVNAIEPLFKGQVICVELHRTLLKKFSGAFDLRDKIFQHLRAIKDVKVVIILTEEGKNRTRINLRSHGKMNVAKLASRFHGGGHSRASGCLIPCPISRARQLILSEVRREL